MAKEVDFLLAGVSGGGGGGSPSGPASGDLGSNYPNPTVTGAHFGGADGNAFMRRAGVWVPSAIAYADVSGTPASLPPSGAASGDLGGNYPSPTVTAGHFGGSAGNFLVNRAGLWVPDVIALADLPAVPQIANAGQGLAVGSDGSLSSTAGAASIGALQANIASQYMLGNNVRGYVRVTVSATPTTVGQDIAIVNFSAALAAQAYILLVPVQTTNAEFGDSVASSLVVSTAYYAFLTQAANTPPSSFNIRARAALTATATFTWFYFVIQ